MASSTRFLSVAAMASSVRGTNTRRLSTEPISSAPTALPSTRIELCSGARRQIREQDDVVAALELHLAHARDLGAGREHRHRVDARGAFDVGGMGG